MGKKVRSAKGELVDFDLLKIKEQIASAPPTLDVQARQDFIDKRLRRRLKRAKAAVVSKVEVDVEPKVAEAPEPPVELEAKPEPVVEAVDQKPTASKKKKVAKKKSKQKARPK